MEFLNRTKPTRAPFAAAMMLAGGVTIGASMGASCQTGQTVAGDVGQVAACVIQHATTDVDPTFETIAAECGGIAVTSVVEIIEALITAQAPSDAGVPVTPASAKAAVRVHHKAAK